MKLKRHKGGVAGWGAQGENKAPLFSKSHSHMGKVPVPKERTLERAQKLPPGVGGGGWKPPPNGRPGQ